MTASPSGHPAAPATPDPPTTPSPAHSPAPGSGALRSTARGAAALLSTQPFTWAATLLSTIFVPRLLGAEGFGTYNVALTISGIAGMLAALGIPEFLRRRVATHPERARSESAAALVLLTAAAAVVALVLGTVPVLEGVLEDVLLLRVVLAGMVVTAAQSVVFSFLVGEERHTAFAWGNAAGVVLSAVAGIGVLALGADVVGYAVAVALAYALVFAGTWWLSGLRLSPDSFHPGTWKPLLSGGVPFLGWNVAIRVRNQIDVALVGALLTNQAAGWLAGAYRVTYIPSFIPNLVVTPLLPALSRSVRDGDMGAFRVTLQRSALAVLALTVPLSTITVALAAEMPGLLQWGSDYAAASPLIAVLSIAQPLSSLDMVLSAGLFALHRERRWLWVAVAASVFNPVFNLVMIPLFERQVGNGALGATVVELSTELVMFGGALAVMPRGILDRRMAWTSAQIALAGVVAGGTAALLREYSVIGAALAGGTAYVLAATALGVLRPRAFFQPGSLRERLVAVAAASAA